MVSFLEKLKNIYQSQRFWSIVFIIVSLIFSLGLNNIYRQLSFDNGFIAALTFTSLILILGTFIYSSSKNERSRNRELVLRFILSGILIIVAFALGGLVGDIKADTRIMAFFSFDLFSPMGIFIGHLESFSNLFGLTLFFYSCFELIMYLKNDSYKNFSRKTTYLIFLISLLFYFLLSGIIFSFFYQPPKLETYKINTTNETLLYISGKPWSVIINLSGFNDTYSIYPSQFISKYKSSIYFTAFAEEIPGVKNSEKCRDYFYPKIKENADKYCSNLSVLDKCGNKLLVYEYPEFNDTMRSTHYYDYYDGYCFDFYVISNLNETDQTEDLLKSIRIVLYYS
jgi:hypothetical protein